MKHFLDLLQHAIRENWNAPALSDYRGVTLTFGEMAREICRMHILFEEAGIAAGDKVALCGRNSVRWSVAYFAILSYKAVAVPILCDFTPSSVAALTLHSDARLLIVDRSIWEAMDAASRGSIAEAVSLADCAVLRSAGGLLPWRHRAWIGSMPSSTVRVSVPTTYTTTPRHSTSCASSAIRRAPRVRPRVRCFRRAASARTSPSPRRLIPTRRGWRILSILPLAHLYGLMFELMYPLLSGCHITFLGPCPRPRF